MPITIKEGPPLEGESLCATCAYAHIQRGFRESEQDVFCGYGQFRSVRFKVRECTDYCDRTVPTRWEMEKIALVIPTTPARKAAGFGGLGFSPQADTPAEAEDECLSTTDNSDGL
jgi:hypothetical protein